METDFKITIHINHHSKCSTLPFRLILCNSIRHGNSSSNLRNKKELASHKTFRISQGRIKYKQASNFLVGNHLLQTNPLRVWRLLKIRPSSFSEI